MDQIDRNKMNMIRPQQSDEPACEGRSPGHPTREAEAKGEAVGVVDDSMSGKGNSVNAGDLKGQNPVKRGRSGVRASRRAMKSGNADGAKGGRKVNTSSNTPGETNSPEVPARDKQGEEDLWQRYGAKHGVWSEKMLEALEKGVKGNVWFSLIDKVYSGKALEQAWEKVASNAGSCGVDGITVGRFKKDSQRRLLVVKEHLKKGSYQPSPVKRVWISKEGSKEKRPLGIPTVRDRVVQTALRMAIEPIFEKEFAEHSYGFRPGRGCKDALRQVDKLLKQGALHVVDVDIKGYFDSIPHDQLLARVKEHVADGRVLRLIEAFLKQDVMEQVEQIEAGTEGTPQGGVISPLLANIYLNPLDWTMADKGVPMIRYADDMVLLCSSKEEAEQMLKELGEWCQKAGLTLHPEKTKIVDMGQPGSYFDFLGYRFKRTLKKRQISRFIRPKSLKRIKDRIRPITKRANGRSMPHIVSLLRPILVGVHGYFWHTHKVQFEDLDSWIRGRLRSILRKRIKKRGRGRGVDHVKWNNHYFAQLGLYSLVHARSLEISSLRNGVNH